MMTGTSNNDHETVARSNESLRDAMDGRITDPKSQSTENRGCGNCGNCNGNCSHSQEDK